MAKALKEIQRADGFWNVSLADPNDYGGPETSGTSFFTYGIAWGINNGLLDSALYIPVVEKAWNGLVTTAVHPDGKLGYVQGVGTNPASSQPVTYETTSDFGVGAFLLAGSEVVKLAKGEMPLPPNLFVDSVKLVNEGNLKIYFNETIQKTSAENIKNYNISSKIEIKSASLSPDGKWVTLSLGEMDPGAYSISFNNLISATGNEIDTGSYFSFVFTNIINVTASGYQSGTTNYPKNAIDYNLTTRWSQEGDGEWIMFELSSAIIVTSVDIAFYNGDNRKAYFDIEASLNGLDFTKIFSGESNGMTNDLQSFEFTGVKAKFVKITGHGNEFSMWNSITEVVIPAQEIEEPSGYIDLIREDYARIYPNPLVNNKLNIQLNGPESRIFISIKDILGIEVYKGKLTNWSEASINLNLKKGIYFVSIDGKNNKGFAKLMVE